MKMVQRKVSNKLGIQANNILKTDKRQANTKPSVQTSEGKNKAPDLKAKKMKKSRLIKRADLDISLRSSMKTLQATRPPGKPPPLGSPVKTPSPKKASLQSSPSKPSYGSPNYMKSTNSSEARKEPKKVSISSSSELHNVAKTLLSRGSSLRKVRTLTKSPSFKHTRSGVNKCSKVVLCEDLDVQRNTCSSTLKDSKFPRYLELNPGATEAEGTSAMKVCPYNYCSLNGNHHKAAPPLRCFLSSRRKLLKTQKAAKPEAMSPRKAKIATAEVDQSEDFFIEICVLGREVSDILSDKSYSENENTVSLDADFSPEDGPPTPAQDQTPSEFSYNGRAEVDNSASISLDEFFGENSDMEWEEGQTNISVQNDDERGQDKPGFKSDDNGGSYFEDFIAEKLKSYFDEDIMDCEWSCFSDADFVPYSDSTQPDEEQIEEPFTVEEEGTIYSEQKDDTADEETISANPDFQSIEEQDSFFSKPFDESIDTEIDPDEATHENYIGRDKENNADAIMEKRISAEDTIEDLLPKIEDLEGAIEGAPMDSDDSRVQVNQSEAGNDGKFNVEKNENEANESMITGSENSKEQNEDCIAAIKAPEMEDINTTEEPEAFTVIKGEPHTKGSQFFLRGSDSSQELPDSCNKLKRSVRCKKENDDSEDGREFNPRGPNFLPLQPDPEAEKVDLRHQEMDERRNAEEWMLDYALQKTVNQLAPARKRKVALLVEAFEAVLPIPKCELHGRRNSSGFAHARPLQACS